MSKTIQKTIYAGFWRRALALLLDSLLFVVLTTPLLYIVYGQEYFSWSNQNTSLQVYGVMDFLITKVLAAALLVSFWHLAAATPGKQLMHLKVLDAQSLQRITVLQGLIRVAAYLVSALPMYLGFIWVAWDKRKQGFHDMIAKTVVVYEEDNYLDESLEQLISRLD